MKNNLSVILIAHNEEATIETMIAGLLKNYSRQILELIIVDDASKDNTASLVEAWTKRESKVRLIIRTPPCGVGRALKTGFSSISPEADYCLTMDSDFVENIGQVNLLINCLEQNCCDGVIGSRFVQGGRLINYPLAKKMMNRLFHWVARVLFGVRQKDLTNNFKLYKAEIMRALPWQSDDYAMNAETGLLPILAGRRIAEVPVLWAGRGPAMGRSKFRLAKAGPGYLRVLRYCRQFLKKREAEEAAGKERQL